MDTVEGIPLTYGQMSERASYKDNAGQYINIGDWNTQTPSPYIPWKKSPQEEHTANTGIETQNSWPLRTDVITEPTDHTSIL